MFIIVDCWVFIICNIFFQIQEGDKEIATKMQELALSEGALPRHLHTSLFTISSDQRMLTNRSKHKTPGSPDYFSCCFLKN